MAKPNPIFKASVSSAGLNFTLDILHYLQSQIIPDAIDTQSTDIFLNTANY
jgi:hypothetical protein